MTTEPKGCAMPGCCSAVDTIAALQRENAKLREALERYGKHDEWCACVSGPCDCGLWAALAPSGGCPDCGESPMDGHSPDCPSALTPSAAPGEGETR